MVSSCKMLVNKLQISNNILVDQTIDLAVDLIVSGKIIVKMFIGSCKTESVLNWL